MNYSKNIYLVGFMGTGKTAVGKELARRLAASFIDLDDLIGEKEGAKIRDIFKDKGEPYFRVVESQVVKKVSQKSGLVVGCGGGVVLDKQNMENLKKSGIVICLEANPEVIISRTKETRQRPLLNVEDPGKRIEELLNKRAPFYARADYRIDTSRLNIEEVTQKIIDLLEKKL